MRPLGQPLLVMLLGASGAWPGVAGAGEPPLLIAPPVIEQGGDINNLVQLPAGPRVRLRASSGSFDSPVLDGGGWVARFHPGEPIEPGAVIIHASRERCGGTWTVSRRGTRAVHAIHTKPLSRVTVVIGGREAGSAVADAFGRAKVSTLVLPGETSCEVRAVDALGNENRSTVRLPQPSGPPPLLAEACAAEVRAGESFLVEVAAADRGGAPARATPIAAGGVSFAPVSVSVLLDTWRVTVDRERPPGPLTVEMTSGAAVAAVTITVLPAAPAIAAPRPPPPPRTVDDGSERRVGAQLGAEVGAAGNLGRKWGTAASAWVSYRPRALGGRLRPRLDLWCEALWGHRSLDGSVLSTELVATAVEGGVGATLLRGGRWDVELELGAGIAWARQRTGGIGGSSDSGRALPSLSLALALRGQVGRGGLVLRAGWRQLFRGEDTDAVAADDNRGLIGLTFGGEVDL